MLLVGLDAAVEPKNFGFAIGVANGASIELRAFGTLQTAAGVGTHLVPALRRAKRALIAIDAPLGWPTELGDRLASHRAGGVLEANPNDLFRRETDRVVAARVGKHSLDVGADRIARTAWKALEVLNQLRVTLSDPIPLAWGADFSGRYAAVEVYPAATLKAWAVNAAGYKKPEAVAPRAALGAAFADRAPWLPALAKEKVDVFDAGLCVIAASDFLAGETLKPTNLERAAREGWIWVRAPGHR